MSAKARASSDIVFVGPTLAADRVCALLPGAQVRGPVAVGDVLCIVDEHLAKRARVGRIAKHAPVGRIAIIDGYFERMAAVWHKEILLALEAGIEVWGAASMGALRAAELAAFGMRGVGSIFERFACGELVADDEVAVAHLPAEYGYKPTSIALVDMRAAIAHATADATADATAHATGDAARLFDLARARFYRERTWDNLYADARTAGVPEATIAALRASAARATCKADDASALLATMATTPRARPTKLRVPRTWALAQLRTTQAQRPRRARR